jgi:hypothetical protein
MLETFQVICIGPYAGQFESGKTYFWNFGTMTGNCHLVTKSQGGRKVGTVFPFHKHPKPPACVVATIIELARI